MTVSELLTASRAAHAEYRKLADDAAKANRKKPEGWQLHLWDAIHFRLQAHDVDPKHVDSSWSEDKSHHEALLAFYKQQLGLQATDK